jgi:hypothetical protein
LLYTRREPREPRSDRGEALHARPELAGATVPVDEQSRHRFPDGVQHDDAGHPDLSRYASKIVSLDNGHDTPNPGNRANELFGWDTTPDNKTWHKASDGHTVLLVDADLHRQLEPTEQRTTEADEPNANRSEPSSDDAQPAAEADGSGCEQTEDDPAAGDGTVPAPYAVDQTSEVDVQADPSKLVVGGDAALARLTFDPSSRREPLGDCFRPGVYDVHNSLDQQLQEEALDILGTAQRAADLGARVDLRGEASVLTIRWDEHDAGTVTDVAALGAFLAGNPPVDRGLEEPTSTAPEAVPPRGASDVEFWIDADQRRTWVDEWVADPEHTKLVTSRTVWQ